MKLYLLSLLIILVSSCSKDDKEAVFEPIEENEEIVRSLELTDSLLNNTQLQENLEIDYGSMLNSESKVFVLNILNTSTQKERIVNIEAIEASSVFVPISNSCSNISSKSRCSVRMILNAKIAPQNNGGIFNRQYRINFSDQTSKIYQVKIQVVVPPPKTALELEAEQQVVLDSLVFSPQSLDFGEISDKESKTKTLRVFNPSSKSLITVPQIEGDFLLLSACGRIPSKGSCSLRIALNGRGKNGSQEGTLSYGNRIVPLSGWVLSSNGNNVVSCSVENALGNGVVSLAGVSEIRGNLPNCYVYSCNETTHSALSNDLTRCGVNTYEVQYSEYGSCSATACMGSGTKTREHTCSKLVDGSNPVVVDNSNCSSLVSDISISCPSPAGSINQSTLDNNGQITYTCPAGENTSSVNTSVAVSCNSGFVASGLSCVIDRSLYGNWEIFIKDTTPPSVTSYNPVNFSVSNLSTTFVSNETIQTVQAQDLASNGILDEFYYPYYFMNPVTEFSNHPDINGNYLYSTAQVTRQYDLMTILNNTIDGFFTAPDNSFSANLIKYTYSQIANTNPLQDDFSSEAIVINEYMYFASNDAAFRQKIFEYNTNSGAVRQISNILPNQGENISYMTKFNNKLYFSALVSTTPTSQKLFSYDPVSGQLIQVSNINPGNNDNISSLYEFNGYLYFVATKPSQGQKLFRLDTSNNISQVSNSVSPFANVFVVANNELYFPAFNASFHDKLYKIDANNNLHQISNINVGSGDGVYSLKSLNDKIYFGANSPDGLSSLYKYDPISNTIRKTARVNQGFDEIPEPIIVFENELYFNAMNGNNQYLLFKELSDGQVVQVLPEFFEFAEDPVIVGNKLFIAARDSMEWGYLNYRAFVITQGTPFMWDNLLLNGTESGNGGRRFFEVYEGEVYFNASVQGQPLRLYKNNISTSGVYPVSNINNIEFTEDIVFFMKATSSGLYFSASIFDEQYLPYFKMFRLKKE